ncbi:unnamed protein product [Lactuca virosa]|uniref:Uncharacterized protein n=1 Tax=Lactuca virosa TaxID=75947 RepID=A0AAU9PA33_9ASTR|nr:unnamed protein product [Lactuca virosa]
MPGRMVKLVTLAPDFSSFLLPFPPSPPFFPSSAPQTRPPLVRSICCLHLRRTIADAGRRSRRCRRTRSRRRRRTHPLVRRRRICVRRPSFSVFPTGSPGRRLHLPSPSHRCICPPNLTASLLDFFPKIDVLLLTTTQSMFEVQLNGLTHSCTRSTSSTTQQPPLQPNNHHYTQCDSTGELWGSTTTITEVVRQRMTITILQFSTGGVLAIQFFCPLL